MLLDRWLPQSDESERHSLLIDAPREVTWETLRHGDIGSSPVIRLLMGLRTLFAARRPRAAAGGLTLDALPRNGFGILEEEPGREIVLGVHGQFWRPAGNVLPFDRALFEQPLSPGLARAAWNFSLMEEGPSRVRVSTETRILCGDDASRRRFRRYWFFVRPFSGLIRIVMLRAIRRQVARSRW